MMRISRRRVLSWVTGLGAAYGLGLLTPSLKSYLDKAPFRRARKAVLPTEPVRAGVGFGDAVARLVAAGAIDREKFVQAQARRGPLPGWVERALDGKPQDVVLSAEAAPHLLNLLWPLGLATRATFNDSSPIKGSDLSNFASTGGWTLGREDNGARYFNSVETMPLTDEQATRVRRLAETVYRPCCNNSAFFQDCNHGSAMLGLMELAASQGRSDAEIMRLAKIANGFWYPQEYTEMALFFDVLKGLRWHEVTPGQALSTDFSSSAGWQRSVHVPLVRNGILMPSGQGGGGGGCAV